MGHSLGGAVAAYWVAVDSALGHRCPGIGISVDLLSHVHSLITFDSPLQGLNPSWANAGLAQYLDRLPANIVNDGAWFAFLADLVASQAGKELTNPEYNKGKLSAVIAAINDPSKGVLARLPHRVLALANTSDWFIGDSTAWVGHGSAQENGPSNALVTDCPLADKVLLCHTSVLTDAHALQWASDMILKGLSPRITGTWQLPPANGPLQGPPIPNEGPLRGLPSPNDGLINAYITAHASNPSRATIDHVNFTAQWQDGSNRQWGIVCSDRRNPERDGDYSCLHHIALPTGFSGQSARLKLGFDVYLVKDEHSSDPATRRLSPDGNRTMSVSLPSSVNTLLAAVPKPTLTPTYTSTPTPTFSPTSTPTPTATISPAVKPGGLWDSPAVAPNSTAVQLPTTGTIHFAAEAYQTSPGDPHIATVNFTIGWPGNNPTTWVTACPGALTTGSGTSGKPLYTCDATLSTLSTVPPAGPLAISFDVTDTMGHVNNAPNGVHTITYAPVTAQPAVKPGGLWVSPPVPSNSSVVQQPIDGSIHFAAEAYTANATDPPIAKVAFTVGWPMANPTTWVTACVATSPSGTGSDGHPIFACDASLGTLSPAPSAGPLAISFDVYDTMGHVNNAPNGVHTITYAPVTPNPPPTSGCEGTIERICLAINGSSDTLQANYTDRLQVSVQFNFTPSADFPVHLIDLTAHTPVDAQLTCNLPQRTCTGYLIAGTSLTLGPIVYMVTAITFDSQQARSNQVTVNWHSPTSIPPPPTTVPSTGGTVDVDARFDWQDSGIAVQPGQTVSIAYVSGLWSPFPGYSYDGRGCIDTKVCSQDTNAPSNICCIVHAGLIGRIGNTNPFAVGNGVTFQATLSGDIFLRINDRYQSDNSGFITVRVTVGTQS